jgi:hypothetical protein
MDRYRIYFVGSDGLFSGAQLLECADDQEAIQTAQQLVDGHDVELGRESAFLRDSGTKVSPANSPPQLAAWRRSRGLGAGNSCDETGMCSCALPCRL